jgi:hypothetical protein
MKNIQILTNDGNSPNEGSSIRTMYELVDEDGSCFYHESSRISIPLYQLESLLLYSVHLQNHFFMASIANSLKNR